MTNWRIVLRFHGGAYHGSQIQENAVTIQEVFQRALLEVFGERPDIKCCSRTDAGVHANRFVISFAGEREMTPYQLLSALNNHLPRDIRVIECAIAPTDFHARYSATGKRYLYKVYNAPVMDPFYNGLALHFTTRIDERMLDELAKVFVGTHSFGAFCSKKAPAEDRVRTVSAFTVTRQGDLVTFAVTADGFLYNMARAMVGTLLNAARGRIDRAGIEQRLRSGERDNLCATAPACGLYLDEVYYEDVSTPTS